MINTSLTFLMDSLNQLLWPFLRISAFMVAAPFFSLDAMSVRIRIAVAVVLTLYAANVIPVNAVDPLSVDGLLQLCLQVYIGALLGFSLQVVNAAVIVAGQVISNSMGLGFASMVDPNLGNVPVLSQLLVIIATLLFLSVGGHLLVIELLLESFQGIPVGAIPALGEWFDALMAWTPYIFTAGLFIALPMLVSLLVVNIGLGIVTRSAPALNIISVGFPAIIVSGVLMINLAMPGILATIEDLWATAFQVMQSLAGGGSGI